MESRIPEKSVFVSSKYLRMDVVDVEKKLMHHRKYVIKVTLDKNEFVVKKKYDDIKKFIEVHNKKYDLSDLQTELKDGLNIRTKKQVEICQKIFNRFNSILRDSKYSEQVISSLKESLHQFMVSQQVHSPDQQETQTNVSQTKVDRKSNLSLSGFVSSSTTSQPKRRTLPFSECWAKLQTSIEWQYYRVWLKDDLLVFNAGVEDDYFYLKGCLIEVQYQPYYALKLSHKFDRSPLQLRLNSIPNVQNDDPDQELYESYILAYSFFKEICLSKDRIDVQVCGKFIVKLYWGDVTVKENDPKQFFLKITHQKVVIITGLYYLKKQLSVSIYIPLLNPFGKLKIQMLTKGESWLHKNLVEICLCQCELLMQEALTAAYQLTPVVYRMPLSHKSEQQDNLQIGHLKCDFQSFGNLQCHFVSNELQIYEGEAIQQELDDAREEIRMSGNRIKRIIYSVDNFKIRVTQLLNFKFPNQSYLFYCFLLLFVWTNESLFRTLMLVFLSTALYTNKSTRQYCWQVIEVLGLKDRYENTLKWLFVKNKNFLEPKAKFKKATEKQNFLQCFQIKMKKAGNIFSKYKRLQQNLFMIRYTILIVVGTVEKLKNLLNWVQPKKTLVFMLLCSGLYIVVGNFPIRYLLILGLAMLMYKKRNFYAKLYTFNRLVVFQVLRITSTQQGEFSDFKQFLLEPNKQFDFSKSYMNHFQKKVAENLQNLTDIQVPPHLFNEHNSVEMVQNHLKTLSRRIRIDKKYRRELYLYDVHPSWFSDGSTTRRFLNTLYSFLYNVPSDRYLLEYKNDWKLKQVPI